ncbi:MAG: hypothetical protein MJZ63_04900, partial [Muribaculaceae bacterium]|nr:hypothetical protein [Muribaculaceae bacterium]
KLTLVLRYNCYWFTSVFRWQNHRRLFFVIAEHNSRIWPKGIFAYDAWMERNFCLAWFAVLCFWYESHESPETPFFLFAFGPKTAFSWSKSEVGTVFLFQVKQLNGS